MSRIQHVLEKAEREGAFQSMRVVVERQAVAPLLPDLRPDSKPAPSVVRVVVDARLDRRLQTAAATTVAAEQYRALRTRILHRDVGATVNLVLVTSPCDGDGKSLTVANLSLAMAQEFPRRVCVVDANLRQPSLHRLFGIPDGPGLSDVLVGRAPLDSALLALEEHHVTVLPAGTVLAHPSELLGTTAMRRTVETLRSRFEAVLVDAPAARPLADVGILARVVDSLIVVVRAGVTPKPAIHDAVTALEGGRLLGIVLNDVT